MEIVNITNSLFVSCGFLRIPRVLCQTMQTSCKTREKANNANSAENFKRFLREKVFLLDLKNKSKKWKLCEKLRRFSQKKVTEQGPFVRPT